MNYAFDDQQYEELRAELRSLREKVVDLERSRVSSVPIPLSTRRGLFSRSLARRSAVSLGLLMLVVAAAADASDPPPPLAIDQKGTVRIGTLEVAGKDVNNSLDDLTRKLNDANGKLSDLTTKINGVQSALDNGLLALRGELTKRSGSLETGVSSLETRVNNLAPVVAGLSGATRFVLAKDCPSGWTKIAEVGILMNRNDFSKNPFANGGDYGGWKWSHPVLCQKL